MGFANGSRTSSIDIIQTDRVSRKTDFTKIYLVYQNPFKHQCYFFGIVAVFVLFLCFVLLFCFCFEFASAGLATGHYSI